MVGRASKLLLVLSGTVSPALGQGEAQLAWWDRAEQRRVGHYFIKTDLPAAGANALARHLNLMHDEYARRLTAMPPRVPTPLNVLLFADQRDYLETLQWRFGVDAGGSGGMFFVNPSGHALAVWTGRRPLRRVLHVLQHEGFHQFAYSRFGTDLPMWVNEGLAELFGEAVVVERGMLFGQRSARLVEHIQRSVELGTYVAFDDMLGMTTADWSAAVAGGTADGLYRQAWSMIHFLVYGDGGRYLARFERYLRLLNEGYPSPEAFRRAFENVDASAFEQGWKVYVLSMRPSGFLTAMERIEFLAAGALELNRQGVQPQTLEVLRRELHAIDFTYALSAGELATELRVTDAMFTIPVDDPVAEPAIFVVSPSRHGRLSKPQQRLEDANPTPPAIETRFLKPRDLSIRWIRDEETNTFSYEIEVE